MLSCGPLGVLYAVARIFLCNCGQSELSLAFLLCTDIEHRKKRKESFQHQERKKEKRVYWQPMSRAANCMHDPSTTLAGFWEDDGGIDGLIDLEARPAKEKNDTGLRSGVSAQRMSRSMANAVGAPR